MGINVPDPPKDDAMSFEVSMNEELAIAAETDSDDHDHADVDSYHGYTMLPAEPNECEANDSDSIDTDNEFENVADLIESTPAPPETSNFDKATVADVTVVWNAPRSISEQPMDSEHAAKVLKAMEGFTLPISATPSWAKDISEDDLKNQLLAKIRKS